MVGDQVEDESEAGVVGGGGQCPQPILAAELVRHAGWIDDVVTVARAGASLQRRRQVQMRDPEVAQVRDQVTGGSEIKRGVELQAVGRPRRAGAAHAGRA